MTAHTPGPWRTNGADVVSNNGSPVSKVILNYNRTIAFDTERAEAEANASLIAAAPDLLEALKDMTHGLPELLENIGYTDEEGMIEKARAAIKKANGAT